MYFYMLQQQPNLQAQNNKDKQAQNNQQWKFY